MKFKKIISYLILILGFLVCSIFYNQLPNSMPLDVIMNSTARTYVNKAFIFMIPIINLIIYFVIVYAGTFNYEKNGKNQKELNYYQDLSIATNFTILYILFILIYVYIGKPLNITKFSFTGIGIVYIVIGKRMDSKKGGYFTDIKTPWTVNSEYVFDKTTKFAKIDFIALGVYNMLLLFFDLYHIVVYNVITIFAIFLIYFYSYCIYKIISIENS